MSKANTPTATPTPRTIDPGIAAIRAESKAKVAEFRKQQRSGEILKRITDELLPKMTEGDLKALLMHLESLMEAKAK